MFLYYYVIFLCSISILLGINLVAHLSLKEIGYGKNPAEISLDCRPVFGTMNQKKRPAKQGITVKICLKNGWVPYG